MNTIKVLQELAALKQNEKSPPHSFIVCRKTSSGPSGPTSSLAIPSPVPLDCWAGTRIGCGLGTLLETGSFCIRWPWRASVSRAC